MADPVRPKTVREIQAAKEAKRKVEQDKVRIFNLTYNQMITIQVVNKDNASAAYQSSVQLGPQKSVCLPRTRLMPDQISNLKAKGIITVTKAQ